MAKNVVLKDRDGNELNVGGKLYVHKINISDYDEIKAFDQIQIISSRKERFNDYNELVSYLSANNKINQYYCYWWNDEVEETGLGLVSLNTNNVHLISGGELYLSESEISLGDSVYDL